jgi:hypothetical protein
MKRLLKWLGIILGGLVGIIVLALLVVYAVSNGREVDREWMPINSLRHLTDDEISALWLFLQSLPPQAQGS